MNIILWVILGGLAGWIASAIMKSSRGILGDILLGVVGGFIGGFVMNLFGTEGITGFNLYSLFVAIIGAVLLIFLARLFTRPV